MHKIHENQVNVLIKIIYKNMEKYNDEKLPTLQEIEIMKIEFDKQKKLQAESLVLKQSSLFGFENQNNIINTKNNNL